MSDSTPPYSAPQTPSPPAHLTSDERTYALLIHLSSFVFPLMGPLVLWLIKRGDSAYIDHHGKEAVNFHITLLGTSLALFLFAAVTCGLGAIITVPAVLVLSVLDIVWTIVAAVRANEGVLWRYPYSMRLVT